jgi:sugar lactone lactonase YvrE
MTGWIKLATFVAVATILATATGGAGATNSPAHATKAGSSAATRSAASMLAARRGALLRHANLRTLAGVKRYLRAIGVDPRGVVIQRGLRNYAGPSCPGAGWACTSTAHPVVQIAADGGKNTFLCTSGSCVVVQATTSKSATKSSRALTAAAATNTAKCNKTTGLIQSCTISQTSATADNVALVVERAKQASSLDQTLSANVTAQITQQATGPNNNNQACVYQEIAETLAPTNAKKGVAVSTTLNATQRVTIAQDAAAGSNTVQNAAAPPASAACVSGPLTQTQTLATRATGTAAITQSENVSFNAPYVNLDIEQNQGAGLGSATGPNTAAFSQTSTLTASASTPAGPVTQTQGSTNSGIQAKVNQFSHGLSTASASQTETQCEHAQTSGSPTCTSGAPPTYELHQVQFGPISNSGGSRSATSRKLAYVKKGVCPPDCSTQADNPSDAFTINQNSTQTNDTHHDQTNTVQGECATSGECTATQTTNENGTTTTHTASGSTVDTSTDCTEGSCTTTTPSGFVSGDLFVSVGNGLVQERTPSGALVRTLDTGTGGYTTGLAFDAGPRLYVTDFSANDVTRFLSDGTASSFGSGYNAAPESIVFDSSGNAYVGQASGSKQVLKFSPSGTLLASYSPAPEVVGTDWIELAPDHCTLYYTSEGTKVHRFDVCTNTQLSDFAAGLSHAFAIKLLPDGGALVADESSIVRFDATGTAVHSYGTGGTLWFSVALDPSGSSFWAGDANTGDVKKFDLTSGAVLASFNTGSTSFQGAADGLAIAP